MNRKIGENRKITLNDIMKSSLLMFLQKKNNFRMENYKKQDILVKGYKKKKYY